MSGKTVTRAELANALYQLRLLNRRVDPPEPISRDQSAQLVEAILQAMSDALAAGEAVKISSFGAFEVRRKAARQGRNPKTGEPAEISERQVLVFRASHILKDRINADGAAADPDAEAERGAAQGAAGGSKADDDAA